MNRDTKSSTGERNMRRRFVGIGLAVVGLLAAPAFADEAGDEQKAMEAIQKAGGTVQVAEDEPGKPAFRVDLGGDKVTDADLESLESLTRLRQLYLGGAHVTDKGLAHLQRLAQLHKMFPTRDPRSDAP